MVSKLKICSTLMRVMNVGDSGPVGVAMQGCEFGQALLVRNKVRKLLNQQRHRVNKHRMDTKVFMFSVFRILRDNFSFFVFRIRFFWSAHRCGRCDADPSILSYVVTWKNLGDSNSNLELLISTILKCAGLGLHQK